MTNYLHCVLISISLHHHRVIRYVYYTFDDIEAICDAILLKIGIIFGKWALFQIGNFRTEFGQKIRQPVGPVLSNITT